LDYDFTFTDGIANINFIKYPEVGEVEFNLSEIKGEEFAKIDSDDTSDNDRLITSAKTSKITILPHHFEIKNVNVFNFNNGSFTYLSRDLNMSGTLQADIVAKNSDNVTTLNYKNGCYSENVNVEISHTPLSVTNLNHIITQYNSDELDKNITFLLKKENFVDGMAPLDLKINFDRNCSKIVTPFSLNLELISVEDLNKTVGNSSINLDLKYIYGRILVKDLSTIQNSVSLDNLFQVYDVSDWSVNKSHNNKAFGLIKGFYSNSNVLVDLQVDSIADGKQIILITPNTTLRPYKAKLHFDVPSWLWYSSHDNEYKAPSNKNLDCMTHPCSNLLFVGQSQKSWGGTGTGDKDNNVSTNTINVDIRQNKNKDANYRKISW